MKKIREFQILTPVSLIRRQNLLISPIYSHVYLCTGERPLQRHDLADRRGGCSERHRLRRLWAYSEAFVRTWSIVSTLFGRCIRRTCTNSRLESNRVGENASAIAILVSRWFSRTDAVPEEHLQAGGLSRRLQGSEYYVSQGRAKLRRVLCNLRDADQDVLETADLDASHVAGRRTRWHSFLGDLLSSWCHQVTHTSGK